MKTACCLFDLTQVEVSDRKSICPDRPRWKVPMSRLSRVHNNSCVRRAFKNPYVQKFARSKPKFAFSKIENLCALTRRTKKTWGSKNQ